MNMKALLGAVLALVLAVGGAAYLVASFARPAAPKPEPVAIVTTIDPLKEYETNPLDLLAPGPKPKVVVEVTHYDFGLMVLGTEQSHDYVFKNAGEGILRLARGPMMCKCTIPAVPDQEIKPGESISIKLTWKPVAVASDFSKEAVIWTNDPVTPKINISIKGEVYEDPMAYPAEYNLGDIPWDQEHEGEVHLMSSTSSDLKVDSVEVSHPEWMSVTQTPADLAAVFQGTKPRPEPKSGMTMKLNISPSNTVGPFHAWIKVKSNIKAEPTTIAVSGIRTGPISIHSQYYQAATSLLDLKHFKSADGKASKLMLSLEPFGQDLHISEAISKSKHLTVTLRKMPTVADAKKENYVLSVQAAKGLTAGTVFTSDVPDELTLKTNHPQVPEIHIWVRYTVN